MPKYPTNLITCGSDSRYSTENLTTQRAIKVTIKYIASVRLLNKKPHGIKRSSDNNHTLKKIYIEFKLNISVDVNTEVILNKLSIPIKIIIDTPYCPKKKPKPKINKEAITGKLKEKISIPTYVSFSIDIHYEVFLKHVYIFNITLFFLTLKKTLIF